MMMIIIILVPPAIIKAAVSILQQVTTVSTVDLLENSSAFQQVEKERNTSMSSLSLVLDKKSLILVSSR